MLGEVTATSPRARRSTSATTARSTAISSRRASPLPRARTSAAASTCSARRLVSRRRRSPRRAATAAAVSAPAPVAATAAPVQRARRVGAVRSESGIGLDSWVCLESSGTPRRPESRPSPSATSRRRSASSTDQGAPQISYLADAQRESPVLLDLGPGRRQQHRLLRRAARLQDLRRGHLRRSRSPRPRAGKLEALPALSGEAVSAERRRGRRHPVLGPVRLSRRAVRRSVLATRAHARAAAGRRAPRLFRHRAAA